MGYYVVCSPSGLESKIKAKNDKMAKTIATQRFCTILMSDLILHRGLRSFTSFVSKKEQLNNPGNPKESFHISRFRKGKVIGIKRYKHDTSLPRMERWSAWKNA